MLTLIKKETGTSGLIRGEGNKRTESSRESVKCEGKKEKETKSDAKKGK